MGVARDAPERALADDVSHPRRRAVVGAPDHRAEQVAVGPVQAAVAYRTLAQVRGEQHHLDRARHRRSAPAVEVIAPAVGVDDREPDVAGAMLRVLPRAVDVGAPAFRLGRGGACLACRGGLDPDRRGSEASQRNKE
jgi:hypothetical protein